ncbi:MAG: hypothetical protein ILO34_08670 [Kiritimatiellae bacterium]|nr:hypothetical protein [Kiritimatiellia bacterium]
MRQKPESGITREELIGWGGEETFNQALAIVNSGDVVEYGYDDDTLVVSGKIRQPDGYLMPTSFELRPDRRIASRCPCRTNREFGMVCPHVVALGFALALDEMPEEQPPEEDCETGDAAGGDFTEIEMRPVFSAYIAGSRASLSVEVDAHYRHIDFPACSAQAARTVYLEQEDDPFVRLVRSPQAEREAMDSLRRWGFEKGYRDGDLKLYLTDPLKVLNFLGAGIPSLWRGGWRVELSENLSALVDSMRSIVPVVKIRDAPGGDFDVGYRFEAGGELVSPAEIQAALNRGDGCILRDGVPYLLDNRAIETMHGVFRDCASSQNGAPPGFFRVRAVHAPFVASSLEALADSIDLDDGEAARWRENALARCCGPDAKFEPVALGRLDGVLRPYQKQGVYWMRFLENAGLCGLLADEMGLGKTLQTLTWIALSKASSAPRLPSLVVCPTSLVRNWEAEAVKFTPWLKVHVVSGADRARDFGKIGDADLVVTSYALLQRDFADAYLSREFDAVVLDEAQRIKNRETKNAKAAKLIRSRKRLVLTGTPVENSVADVWSIFDFLLPGYLGEYESFREYYEQPIADGGEAAVEAQARLKRKLAPFILRRLKKSVAADLPDKIVKISYCPMDEEGRREYDEALKKTRREAGDALRKKGLAGSRFEILAMLMRLRLIASAAKMDAFCDNLRAAVDGGHKILVFSQFVKTLAKLAERLDGLGIRYAYLDGSTKDRLDECNRFNRSPDIPVFLISLMAGGTGLNLTGADMVMHYDPWWNPAVEDQATDRAHRIGQKKVVYVMKMIASNSIEERVLALQRKKQALIKATVSSTDAEIAGRLTADDIAALLK